MKKPAFCFIGPWLKEFRWRTGTGSMLTSDNAPNVAGSRSLGACRPRLDWFALELDPAAALRVENVVRSRAEGMRSAEAHAKSLWIGTAVAIFLTFTGSAVMWRPLAWLASQWNLPSGVWQIVFAAFWLVPSLLLALLPLFRRSLLGEDSDNNGQTV